MKPKYPKEINILIKASQDVGKVADYVFDIEDSNFFGNWKYFLGIRMDETEKTICYGIGNTREEALDDLRDRALDMLAKLAAGHCGINPEHVGIHVFI